MLKALSSRLWRLIERLRWPLRRRSSKKPKIIIQRLGRPNLKSKPKDESNEQHLNLPDSAKPIRIATFNAAMFAMAPAVPEAKKPVIVFDYEEQQREGGYLNSNARSGVNDHPKSILKKSPSHSISMSNSMEGSKQQRRSKLRVTINLPDDEISLERRSRQLNFNGEEKAVPLSSAGGDERGKAPMRSCWSLPTSKSIERDCESFRSKRSILEVLREVDADILALQDVEANEEKGMKPLSDLAGALGMNYVFAESWAPEYGNAILSKWPIKMWKVQKICNDRDFKNVLKATVDVPQAGEVNFYCTHLDLLNEEWRMKQINAILQSEDAPHILAGGLNSLDQTDYSLERWNDIVKYHVEIGKPAPKLEVMKFLKGENYVDAKLYAGECESVVMIAKGQDVQGTWKYGTRVDYILSSPDSPYEFVPGSYAVISSKGTSDHHIVKVDIKVKAREKIVGHQRQHKKKVVKITNPSSATGIWKIRSR